MEILERIRILGESTNERGDTFTRLTRDLFFALGYDELRLNVHKSGREIDVQGHHRVEKRRLVAECKAHIDPVGGSDLNKFFGVLTRERVKCSPIHISGYFLSLGGFRETAIEQENETGPENVVLIDAARMIKELERSNVLISFADAATVAGKTLEVAGLADPALDSAELLGHPLGYIWAFYFSHGKEVTHYALIHADGTPLSERVSGQIAAADASVNGRLGTLTYLKPKQPTLSSSTAKEAIGKYKKWLSEECGYIHLDGLPADTDLSATRLKLEKLFVPLRANYLPEKDDDVETRKLLAEQVTPIGNILRETKHLAVLAIPGGGKSTLIKRLATAYAFPGRRAEVNDALPDENWLPLFLRCRELRDRAHRPIVELLADIPRHSAMTESESVAFTQTMHLALHAGNAILLVDGLDEISDEGARQAFANHLRTFVGMFPQIALLVTSREAGFRLVAGVVASACRQVRLAPMSREDVIHLCERWHVEVVGDTKKIREEATALGHAIWENGSIRTLAENPLLLTTLLVVKRWIGELPRSRGALYREAIRVLVRTWNVEGYAPLDEEETLAQLSYVGCAMMAEGKQQISQRALLSLLQKARHEMDIELRFTRISANEFLERIEYRSSLLMQVGHEVDENEIQPIYEFRHLTFQEYLAARGFVAEQYPGRNDGKTLSAVLEPHFKDERWFEVIPLAAVLAGRKADELVRALLENVEKLLSQHGPRQALEEFLVVLFKCVSDEVQLSSTTLRKVFLELSRESHGQFRHHEEQWVSSIMRGKFADAMKEAIEEAYCDGDDDFADFLLAFSNVTERTWSVKKSRNLTKQLAKDLQDALSGVDRRNKIRAAVISMGVAYENGRDQMFTPRQKPDDTKRTKRVAKRFEPISKLLGRLITTEDLPLALAAAWAYAWLGQSHLQTSTNVESLVSLFSLWRQCSPLDSARWPAWALVAQPLAPRDSIPSELWGDCDEFLKSELKRTGTPFNRRVPQAAVIVGWYRRAPWSDSELVDLISKQMGERGLGLHRHGPELLLALGEDGKRALDEVAKRKKQSRVAPTKKSKGRKITKSKKKATNKKKRLLGKTVKSDLPPQ